MNKLKATIFLLSYQVFCIFHNQNLFHLLWTFFSLLSWGNSRFRILTNNFSILFPLLLSKSFVDVGDRHFLKFFLGSFLMTFAIVLILKCVTSLGPFTCQISPKIKKFDPTFPPMSEKTVDLIKIPNKSKCDRSTSSTPMCWHHMWSIS